MRIRTPILAAAAAALGLTIGGAVVAVADIPSANGTIRACYDSGGNVKLIDEGNGCPKGFKGPISWNQQGAPGEDGTQLNISSRYQSDQATMGDPINGFLPFTALCRAGDIAVSWRAFDVRSPFSTEPVTVNGVSGWRLWLPDPSIPDMHAVCLDITP